MGRLSIEIPEHQHKKIKALAAWHGLSLKDYIVEKTIPAWVEDEEDPALKELIAFLERRIQSAKQGDISRQSMADIIAKAKSQRRS